MFVWFAVFYCDRAIFDHLVPVLGKGLLGSGSESIAASFPVFTGVESVLFDSDTRFFKSLSQHVDLFAELVALLLCIFSPHILIVPLVRQADNLSIPAGESLFHLHD